jgi:hypothetical protein
MKAKGANEVSLIQKARRDFHRQLMEMELLTITGGIPSNADKDSAFSVQVSQSKRMAGQTAGMRFEQATREFIAKTFLELSNLRPGKWDLPSSHKRIALFEQYSHLDELEKLAENSATLAVAMGRNYVIEPDVVIVRRGESDEAINFNQTIVDRTVATRSSLREINGGRPMMHASISCKWTLRNDRAQNSRSEALNLVRNRKGRLPHVVVVTAEPFPPRLASLALGTGDIDCVYHFALPELEVAVAGNEVAASLVHVMVEGKRLKDISDLPLDLAI